MSWSLPQFNYSLRRLVSVFFFFDLFCLSRVCRFCYKKKIVAGTMCSRSSAEKPFRSLSPGIIFKCNTTQFGPVMVPLFLEPIGRQALPLAIDLFGEVFIRRSPYWIPFRLLIFCLLYILFLLILCISFYCILLARNILSGRDTVSFEK